MEELLSLDWMAQGGLQKRFENALAQVRCNIADINYEAKAKRRIRLTFKLTVSENRTNADLAAEVKVELPTEGPAIAAIMIGTQDGELCATERVTPLLPIDPPPGPRLLDIEANLKDFAEGTLNARFHDAFTELLENATDYNTPAKALRKIIIIVEFVPNMTRTHASVSIDVRKTVAKPHALETTLLIGEPADAGPVEVSQISIDQMNIGDTKIVAELGKA